MAEPTRLLPIFGQDLSDAFLLKPIKINRTVFDELNAVATDMNRQRHSRSVRMKDEEGDRNRSETETEQQINVPEFVVRESQFLKNYDPIIKKLSEYPVSSYEGYNKIVSYLNDVRRSAIKQVVERSSEVSRKIFRKHDLEPEQAEKFSNELKNLTTGTTDKIKKHLEHKHEMIEKLLFNFKSSNVVARIASEIHEDFFNENEALAKLLDINRNLKGKINERFVSANEAVNSVLGKLKELESLASEIASKTPK